MNRVLTEIQDVLEPLKDSKFRVKRIVCGKLDEKYKGLIQNGEYPAILITEDRQRNEKSPFANCITKVFEVDIFIFYKNSVPEKTYKGKGGWNDYPTHNELLNEIQYLFSKVKTLNGEVTRWSEQFDVESFTDANNCQVLKVTSNWANEFVNWSGFTGDQRNLRVDPNIKTPAFIL